MAKTIIVDLDGVWEILGEDDPLTAESAEQAVETILDQTAKSMGYDSIISACSYAGYSNAYQDEAIRLGIWRSEVWSYCYKVLTDIESGSRSVPTLEQLIDELPKFTE